MHEPGEDGSVHGLLPPHAGRVHRAHSISPHLCRVPLATSATMVVVICDREVVLFEAKNQTAAASSVAARPIMQFKNENEGDDDDDPDRIDVAPAA
ncbi:hypothetical protein H6P81_019789 [Aristolochia fimbriata]|uniref:Uncharacterized protein n=1 Tax=Aristolochia fimbriata TaxID=158543 RepID=A0AAV7DSZ2_ARIFI|nr:hypothetical protein H6P81_019789 [Aristolochia fimbriata]